MNNKDQQKLLNLLLAFFALWVVWKLVNHSHNSIVEGQANINFADLDTNGDGMISKDEAEDYFGEDYDDDAFDDADENEDGSISGGTEFDNYLDEMGDEEGGDEEGGDEEGGDEEGEEEEGGEEGEEEEGGEEGEEEEGEEEEGGEEGEEEEGDDEEGDDGFANKVEPYSGFEGFQGVEDLYEGQDNQDEDKDDICSLFKKMETHDDCKKIKGKGTYMIRKHCKKCMK